MSTTLPKQPALFGLRANQRISAYLLIALLLLLVMLFSTSSGLLPASFPPEWDLRLREPVEQFKSWVIGHRTSHPIFLYGFDPVSALIESSLRGLEALLLFLPWPAVLIALYALGYRAGGHRTALLSVAGFVVMGLFGLWAESIETLALMGVSVVISLLIGIPLGILAARHPRFDAFLRPLLDAMQTLPAFVYLIPVLLFFGIARAPSVIATVIYALPPAIRLTSLGLRQVDAHALEAAESFGSTGRQTLFKVQLPLALPSILLGVNQTIMMALGIVVIAALIGAGGLGWEVLDALRNLRVGQALEAGLAIVLLAVIFDRISSGFAQRGQQSDSSRSTWHANVPGWLLSYVFWAGVLILLLIFVVVDADRGLLRGFPNGWRVSIRQPVDEVVGWAKVHLYKFTICADCAGGGWTIGAGPFSDFLVIHLLNPLRSLLQSGIPWPLLIAALGLVAHWAGGWRLALGAMAGLLLLGLLGLWQQSMDTLSQVLVALALTVVIGLPLGILSARSPWVERVLRPLLDFLQTIPPFVYLVPVIMLFNVGRVPGIIASVLYALPPMIRLTSLGIQQVSPATVEAADLFGSTPWQKLVKVQLPLAMPSIMMGVNQAVMMVLSMVIIAGLVGGGALGLEAVNGLARSQLGRGLEAGIAIVILAIILDRITQSWTHSRANLP
jgi:glycine betaine/proline transport system permease protein